MGLAWRTKVRFTSWTYEGKTKRAISKISNWNPRWASHILNAQKVKEIFPNIIFINYSELKNNYKKTIKYICNKLKIDLISSLTKPDKTNYIYGKDIKISYEEKKHIKSFIKEEIQKYPDLPNDIVKLFT